MIEALEGAATIASTFWVLALCAAMIGRLAHEIGGKDVLDKVWRGMAQMHQEAWLFAPPGLLIAAVHHWHSDDQKWLFVFDALNLFNWWYYRNWPEDNHWKRRGKKAKEAIERRAGRLVVVPATGGAS